MVLAIAAVLVLSRWNRPTGPPAPPNDSTASASSDGRLVEIQPGIWQSRGGLCYRPGSAQGHRLDHLMTHAHDRPDRPGSHGVFEVSTIEGITALIDEAYHQAERGLRTHKSVDRQRTVYTVDLGRSIGFVGGRGGRQRGNPPARHLRIVLEGRNVITAYPVTP